MSQIRMFLPSVLVCALLSAREPAALSPAIMTLVKASRLLDPPTGNVVSLASVLIEDGKIKAVGSASQIPTPAGVKIIDLGSATLLPGLIDSHTHLLLDVTLTAEAESTRRYNSDFATGLLLAITMSPSERVLRGAPSWHAKIWKAVSQLCAISATPALTEMLRCAMRLTQAASPA